MKNLRTLLVALATLVLAPALLLNACGGDDPATTTGSGGSGNGNPTGGAGGTGEGICLLNNCSDNTHCVGCPDGRDTCLVAENRCVACDPNTQEGCAPGEECSGFGICVPTGLTCPSDNAGNPEVVCTANSDCLACSPQHQVCDTVTAKCQACIETNTQHCLSSDICVDNDNDGRPETCSPKCPQNCDADNDCSLCGGPGNEAHACFQHKCAECSDTFPCAAGFECTNGVCTPPCGLPGDEAGTCTANEDCQFCGETMGTWDCKTPVNDPTHGFCAPPANGCADLGTNVAVLPPPYDGFTQSCSSDGDCAQAQAGILYNVGKALRDLLGTNELNLGFHQAPIQDANVFYAMPICADIQITETISCGICVPCKQDSDCMPINVDNVLIDMFSGDVFATLAGAFLIDLLWGDNEDHNLNFFCQQIAGGYGACIPCGNPLSPCGNSGGGGGMGGTCDHPVCEVGGPLTDMCSTCAADVCAADPFCCGANNGTWDAACINTANAECNNICAGGGACAHTPCEIGATGTPLSESCSQCVADICAADPYCCQTDWDQTCANQVPNHPSCATACGGGCSHDACVQGGNLDPMCDAGCVDLICQNDSYCCDTDWDSICVGHAANGDYGSACGCN
jgi:hypothetical protein